MINKCDALGNPIIIGNFYGYTLDDNGHTSAVVCEAVKICKVRISVKRLIVSKGLWNDTPESIDVNGNATTSVNAIKLWSVALNDIKGATITQGDTTRLINPPPVRIESEWNISVPEFHKSEAAALISLRPWELEGTDRIIDDGDTLDALMDDGLISIIPIKMSLTSR